MTFIEFVNFEIILSLRKDNKNLTENVFIIQSFKILENSSIIVYFYY